MVFKDKTTTIGLSEMKDIIFSNILIIILEQYLQLFNKSMFRYLFHGTYISENAN